MALSVGSGEYKQKLIKILVFVPSGSIVGFTRSARASAGANKNRHLKTFRTRKPTARSAHPLRPQYSRAKATAECTCRRFVFLRGLQICIQTHDKHKREIIEVGVSSSIFGRFLNTTECLACLEIHCTMSKIILCHRKGREIQSLEDLIGGSKKSPKSLTF